MRLNFKILYILVILITLNSCQEIRTIDRTIKKTFRQVNKFERQTDNYSKKLGINNNENQKNESNADENNSKNYINPLDQKNIINEQGYLFEIINGVDPGKVFSTQSEFGTSSKFVVRNSDSTSVNKDVEVFGWHPHWMSDTWKNYPFQLLTTVSYFSYKVDPSSGDPQNTEDLKVWSNSLFVETAKRNNTRVLLTVSLHGEKNVIDFLNTENIWENVFEKVSNLILDKEAQGIDINFENIPFNKVDRFIEFVEEFHDHLDTEFEKKNQSSPFISLTIPPSEISENFPINKLSNIVDLYVIMGYDLHSDKEPGPTSPLQSEKGGYSLNKIIDRYEEYGIGLDKTILALPYYGIMYDISVADSTKSEIELKSNFERKLTYSEISKLFIENQNLKINTVLDPLSMSKELTIVFDDYSMKEIFYDDSYTLFKKYSFAFSKGMKGIGIWALGYDNNRTELWNIIDENFTTDELIVNDPIAEINGFPIRFAKSLVKDKYIYFTIIIFLTFSVIIALIILLNDINFRQKIANSRLNSIFLLTILYIFLIPLIVFINDTIFLDGFGIYINSKFNIYTAAFLGAFFFYLGTKIKIKKEERP